MRAKWAFTKTRRLVATQMHCGGNSTPERSLRGFAVGRNNWTFFGSDNVGKTAAVLRSFVTSCELVKIDRFAWFRDVLGRVADDPTILQRQCKRL